MLPLMKAIFPKMTPSMRALPVKAGIARAPRVPRKGSGSATGAARAITSIEAKKNTFH